MYNLSMKEVRPEMAHYIVRARLKPELAAELRSRLETDEIDGIRPFGRGLADGLRRARRDPDTGEVLWEEQCFCTPPLAAERVAVLDKYFDAIATEEVNRGEGWGRLESLPALWDE